MATINALKNKKRDKTPSEAIDQSARLVRVLQEIIAASKNISEEEAFQTLKNTDGDLNKNNYKIIEQKLIHQLLDSVWLEEDKPLKQPFRQAAMANSYRDFATASALFANSAYLKAEEMLEGLLQQSIKQEFTNLTVDITRILKSRYRIYRGGHKAEIYTRLNRVYEEKRRLENLAFDRFEEIQDQYVRNRTSVEHLYPAADAAYQELQPFLKDCDTSLYTFFVCEIGIIKHMAENDCKSVLHLIDTNLRRQLKTKSRNNTFLLSLYWQKLTCQIQLQINEPGDKTAKSFLKLCEPGSFNWFKGLEAFFYHFLHTKRYSDALKIYAQMVSHPRFKEMPSAFRDSCNVLKGYLYLLGKLGKIALKKLVAIPNEFDHRDYGSINSSVMVRNSVFAIPYAILYNLLNLVEIKSKDQAESDDNLKACRQRYLNKDTTRRSRAFVDLLLAVPKGKRGLQGQEFKHELEILAAERPPRPEQIFGMEIIPYEDIWEMLSLHIAANREV